MVHVGANRKVKLIGGGDQLGEVMRQGEVKDSQVSSLGKEKVMMLFTKTGKQVKSR
jgi:hypothetical protein